jgi:hypothetical protein
MGTNHRINFPNLPAWVSSLNIDYLYRTPLMRDFLCKMEEWCTFSDTRPVLLLTFIQGRVFTGRSLMNLLHSIISLFGRRKSGQATRTLQTREILPPTKKQRVLKRLLEQSYTLYLAFQCIYPCHLPFPDEIDDTSDASLSASLQHYFEGQWAEYKAQSECASPDFYLTVIASGLLVYGRLEMVDVILDNLAEESYVTDHGAGQCNLFPMLAIGTTLPIPGSICRATYFSGHIDIQATREWFHANRERLEWNEEMSRFVLRKSD